MALFAVLFRLLHGHFAEALLVGLAPVDAHAVNGGQDDQSVGLDQLSQLGGGKVLVDDSGRAVELAVSAHDGNAAAADGNDHTAVLDEGVDGVLLNNVDGLGRRNDLTVAAACVLNHGIALFRCDLFRSFLVVESADGLGGVLEGRVVLVHQNLCHNGGNFLFHSTLGQLVADGVLQMVADVALAHSAALRERHIGLDGLGLGSGGHTKVDHAHLGAVAVGNDDLVALGDQVNNGLCRLGDESELFIRGIAQSVAAESDYDSFRHNFFSSLYYSGSILRILPLCIFCSGQAVARRPIRTSFSCCRQRPGPSGC